MRHCSDDDECEIVGATVSLENAAAEQQRAIPGMETVIASISGYRGEQKEKLVKLINKVGAVYTAILRGQHTHVVCWKFSGDKYQFARDNGITVVNHRWFEHSLRDGCYLPEEQYTWRCGREVGPLQWKETVQPKQELKKLLFRVPDLVDTLAASQAKSPKERSRLSKGAATTSRAGSRVQVNGESSSSYRELLSSRGKRKLSLSRESGSNLKQKKVEDSFIQVAPAPDASPRSEAAPDSLANEPPKVDEKTAEIGDPTEELVLTAPEDMEISCAICYASRKSDVGGYLHCGHDFCFDCIAKWADQKSPAAKCPLCNAAFDVITKKNSSGFAVAESVVVVGQVACKHATWWPSQEPACISCRSRDTDEQLLTCGRCHMRAVHTFCLDPPWLSVAPWICRPCSHEPRYSALI